MYDDNLNTGATMSGISKRSLIAFLILALSLGTSCTSVQAVEWPPAAASQSEADLSKIEFQQISLNKAEASTREASVKVYTELGGHGSGTYFLFEGYHVVFTAAHVAVNGNTFLVADKYGNNRIGTLAYRDRGADFAIILIPAFRTIRPINFKTPNYKPTKEIGKELIFSGYPGSQSLRTVRALIAGVEGRRLVMQSTAWKGSSGSCVFDSDGNFVGIVFALSMAQFRGKPVLLESMIWVDPYTSINWVAAKRFIRSLN